LLFLLREGKKIFAEQINKEKRAKDKWIISWKETEGKSQP